VLGGGVVAGLWGGVGVEEVVAVAVVLHGCLWCLSALLRRRLWRARLVSGCGWGGRGVWWRCGRRMWCRRLVGRGVGVAGRRWWWGGRGGPGRGSGWRGARWWRGRRRWCGGTGG